MDPQPLEQLEVRARAGEDPDQVIDRVADAHLQCLQSGAVPDRQRILRDHPQIADRLSQRLDLVERVFNAARSARAMNLDVPAGQSTETSSASSAPPHPTPPPHAAPASPTPFVDGSDLPPRASDLPSTQLDFPFPLLNERAVRLACPHCGSEIQVVEPAVHDVACRNCGSTFHVDSWPTVSYHPVEQPRRIGRFEVLELLGRGGFGAVFKARDTRLDRIVAIKVPRAGYFERTTDPERFLREARSAARLRHPNIVQVHEIAHERSMPYIVSEFIDGLTLSDLLSGEPLPFREAAELIAGVCDALEFAHQHKVIHRDMKPSNILLDTLGQPHITDFGLARYDDAEITITLDGQVLGTPAYMSPEQAAGNLTQVGPASDVYSVGVILYRMLTREMPFRGIHRMVLHHVLQDEPRSPRSLNDRIPHDLETICLKAMAKERAKRYSSARAMADDLRRWQNGEPIHARPIGRGERAWRWCKRNPVIAALLASVASLLLVVATGASWAAWNESSLRRLAESHERESRLRLMRLYENDGLERMERGDYPTALVWYLEALKISDAPNDPASNARIRLASLLRECPDPVAMWFHDGPAKSAMFSHDGQRVITASEDGTARVCDVQQGKPIVATYRHSEKVELAVLSADGRLAASAGWDGTVHVWNVQGGTRVGAPLQHEKAVKGIEFSPDGQSLLSVSNDGKARIWNTANVELRRAFADRGSSIIVGSFSPDGSRVLTIHRTDVGKPGEAWVWHADSGEPIAGPFGLEQKSMWHASWSADGKFIVTAGEDFTARVWDAKTGKPTGTVMRHDAGVVYAVFSSDDRHIVTASQDETARVWDAQTGLPVALPMRHDAIVYFAEFSRDGGRVVTASRDGSARVWSVSTSRPVTPPLRHGDQVFRARFSPDGQSVLTAGFDGIAKLWDVRSDALEYVIRHADFVWDANFSPDGTRVVTASADGTARVADLANRLRELTLQPGSVVVHASFTPDGRHILTAGFDGVAQLWDATTGLPASAPMKHAQPIRHAHISADGRWIATASEDQTARVWDAATAQSVVELKHAKGVNHVQFSPDNRLLATASDDGTARVWDAATGAAITAPLEHEDRVRHIYFSSDGKLVVTSSWDGTAIVWSVDTGKAVGLPLKHARPVVSAVFEPAGQRVATACFDHSARIWNFETGKPIAPTMQLPGLRQGTIAYSPNGRLLLSTGGAETSSAQLELTSKGGWRVWDAATGQPVTPLMRRDAPVVRAAFSADGQMVVTAGWDHTARVIALRPEPRPLEELFDLAQLRSHQRVDDPAGLMPLSTTRVQELWGKRQRVAHSTSY